MNLVNVLYNYEEFTIETVGDISPVFRGITLFSPKDLLLVTPAIKRFLASASFSASDIPFQGYPKYLWL